MDPAGLHCFQCRVRIEGPIETNEFAALSADDLHLLRIFVWAEGRIRDMEAPLGLSYPTIRTRLAKLKEGLRLAPSPAAAKADARPGHSSEPQPAVGANAHFDSPDSVLNALDSGDIDFETALKKIKKGKK